MEVVKVVVFKPDAELVARIGGVNRCVHKKCLEEER